MWIRYDVLKIIALLLITAGLLGCPPGGSSGNNGGNQNTTDTTPPIISSTVPVNNATDVAVNTRIVAIFNEPPDTSTISTSTFLVSDGSGTIAGSVLCSFKTATFTPSANLATGATYTVTITTAVRDLVGNPLAFDRVWHFTTGNLKAWSQQELLDTSAGYAGGPAVAADRLNNGSGDGTVIVAWGQDRSIYASRYAGSWSAPFLIGNDISAAALGSEAYGPRIAMGSWGDAFVLYGYRDTNYGPANQYSVWSTRYAGGWSTPQQISSVGGNNANGPQPAFDDDDATGNAIFAVWYQYQFGSSQSNYRITQRQYHGARCTAPFACGIGDPSLIGWQGRSLLDPHDIGDASEPQIAAWGIRNAVAVWTQNVTGLGNRTYANIATNGTWTTGRVIDPQGGVYATAGPVVAADPSGNAIAVWMEWAPGRTTLMASRYSTGNWSAPTQIDDVSGGNAGDWDPPRQQVVMDGSGNAIIVWQQVNANRSEYNIYARRCPAGPLSGCGSLVSLETSTGYADFPQVAVAPNGDAIAVWKQEDGSARRIYANHYTAATNSWNANPTRVGGANGTWSEGPQIAIDGSGRATVVWTEFENSEYNIYAVRYE